MDEYQETLHQIKDLLKNNIQGMSVTEIAKALGKNKHSVGRYLDILRVSGHVEMRNFGMAKVFTLSQRVPLSALLDYSRELIMVLDRDHRIVQINDNFLNTLGLPRHEVTGKNIEYLVPASTGAQEFLQKIVSSLAKGLSDMPLHIIEHGTRHLHQKTIPTVFDDGTQGLTVLLEDITEHVHAHNALRASEERFRLMAENLQDGIIIVENNKVVFANSRLTEITGYSGNEIAELSPHDLAADEEKKKISDIIAKAESGSGIPSELRFWLIRKDGERRYIFSRITTYQHGNDSLRYIIVSDITGWKESEDALRNQYNFLQHLIDSYPHPIYYVDTLGKILGCNGAFSKIVGKLAAEVIGKNVTDLFSPTEAKLYYDPEDLSLTSAGTYSINTNLTCSDGSVRQVRFHKSAFTTPGGNRAGIIGIIISPDSKAGTENANS